MARPFNAYGDTSVEITEPSHRLVHVLIICGSAPVEKSAVRASSSSIVFPFPAHYVQAQRRGLSTSAAAPCSLIFEYSSSCFLPRGQKKADICFFHPCFW